MWYLVTVHAPDRSCGTNIRQNFLCDVVVIFCVKIIFIKSGDGKYSSLLGHEKMVGGGREPLRRMKCLCFQDYILQIVDRSTRWGDFRGVVATSAVQECGGGYTI